MHIETNHVRAKCLLQCWSGLAQAAACISVPVLSYEVGLEFSMDVSRTLSTVLSSRISLSFSSSKSRFFFSTCPHLQPAIHSMLIHSAFVTEKESWPGFHSPSCVGLIGQAPNITNHKNWVVDIPQKEVAAVSLWGVTAGLCSYPLH